MVDENGLSLVIVGVEGVEGITIVGHYLKQGAGLIGREHWLALNGSPQHPHELTQFCNLRAMDALVYGIAFHEVVL